MLHQPKHVLITIVRIGDGLNAEGKCHCTCNNGNKGLFPCVHIFTVKDIGKVFFFLNVFFNQLVFSLKYVSNFLLQTDA